MSCCDVSLSRLSLSFPRTAVFPCRCRRTTQRMSTPGGTGSSRAGPHSPRRPRRASPTGPSAEIRYVPVLHSNSRSTIRTSAHADPSPTRPLLLHTNTLTHAHIFAPPHHRRRKRRRRRRMGCRLIRRTASRSTPRPRGTSRATPVHPGSRCPPGTLWPRLAWHARRRWRTWCDTSIPAKVPEATYCRKQQRVGGVED